MAGEPPQGLAVGDGDQLFTVFTIAKSRSGEIAGLSWGAKTVRSSAATGSARMSGSWHAGGRSAGRICAATFRR